MLLDSFMVVKGSIHIILEERGDGVLAVIGSILLLCRSRLLIEIGCW